MPTIKDLRQRHPSIDVEEYARLRALYEGGKRFKEHLRHFLPPRPSEPEERYKCRQREAVHRNYLGPIVDYFTALLFSSSPRALAKGSTGEVIEELDEFYANFNADCDGLGTDFDDTFQSLLTDAMVSGTSWIWPRHPAGDAPTNRAQFEASGIGNSWIKRLTVDDVLDWESDDTGQLAWAIVYEKSSRRTALSGGRSTIIETWYHLLPDRVDTYQIEYQDDKKPDEASTEVPKIASDPHRYGAVPLICLDLPPALWVASRLESPQLAHFRLTNAQTWGMAATCYAMPVVKVKDPKQFQALMGSGYGFYIHPDESVEWTAPDAAPFDALREEIRSHKDEIFRIANTMALGVENNAAAVGRSAESKAADARATAVVLQAYAAIIKEVMERTYDLVSRARSDTLEWSIDGLDDFGANDIVGMVEMLEQIETAGGIPSKTFNVEFKSRLAESLMPDLEFSKKQAIRKEIESGIDDQSADAKREREERQLGLIRQNMNGESEQAKSKLTAQPPGASPS